MYSWFLFSLILLLLLELLLDSENLLELLEELDLLPLNSDSVPQC